MDSNRGRAFASPGRIRGAVAVAMLAGSLAAAAARAQCLPPELVRAITEADGVRVLSTGGCDPTRAALFDPSGRTFCGCRGKERVVLSEAESAGLRRVFGDGGAYDCDPVPLNLGWGTEKHGAVAIEFGSGDRRVEMLLLLPAGQVLVRLADGPRYALRGSPECAERWRDFLAACARERSRSPRSFLNGLLDHWEHGATGSAAGAAGADSNCAQAPVEPGTYEDGLELPEAVTRVQPEFAAPDGSGEEGATARVVVQALVCRDGTVHPDVRIQQGVPGADVRVVAAVRRWTFRPALAGGRPAPTWVAIPFEVPTGR